MFRKAEIYYEIMLGKHLNRCIKISQGRVILSFWKTS